MNPPGRETVRCPTCRAVQEWSETCRRCKSDLRLLWDVEKSYHKARWRCLEALGANDSGGALRAARSCLRLRPDAESRRLMALSSLLGGDWPTALALARDSSPGE